MARWVLAGLLLTMLVPLAGASGGATDEAEVYLIIAAPGHNTGSAWYGHAGILVRDGSETRYYHYQLDLDETPLRPAKTALGQARFRLFAWDEPGMLDFYGDQGREVRSLRLHLDDAARRLLLSSLEEEVAAGAWWPYDMIYDNCATRIRDWLDAATGGALKAATDAPGPSLRERAVPYIAHAPAFQFVSFLVLGHAADSPMTDWDALLLPLDLEAAVLDLRRPDGTPYADAPTVLREATGTLVPAKHSLGWSSAGTGFAVGSALALLGGRNGQDRRRAVAWACLATGAALGVLSLLLLTVSVASPDPLWSGNLDLLLVPPFALALPLAAGRVLRGEGAAWHALRWTAALLVGAAALVWILEATGAIVQDSRLFLAVFLPIYLGLLVAVERNQKEATAGDDVTTG